MLWMEGGMMSAASAESKLVLGLDASRRERRVEQGVNREVGVEPDVNELVAGGVCGWDGGEGRPRRKR